MTIAEAIEITKKYSGHSYEKSKEKRLADINRCLPIKENKELYDCPVCNNCGGVVR